MYRYHATRPQQLTIFLMKREEILTLFQSYEDAACMIDETECWSARELCSLLGYTQWRNFINVIDKAKDFVAEMTSVNVQTKDLQGEASITREHVDNNAAVRKMLTERGIIPENLPPAEDVKKVERRLASEQKKMVKNKKN